MGLVRGPDARSKCVSYSLPGATRPARLSRQSARLFPFLVEFLLARRYPGLKKCRTSQPSLPVLSAWPIPVDRGPALLPDYIQFTGPTPRWP